MNKRGCNYVTLAPNNLPISQLKEIFDLHHKKVFNISLNIVQNTEDAEDITQEVFVEVYHSLAKFNQQSSVSTWIYRITVNKSLDFLRKKKRQKRFGFMSSLFFEDSGELKHDKPNFEHPGILMENKEKSKYLFMAINELPENQKTAFVLFNLEDLSQKEIAEIMNTSPKAVESLIQRAKQSLREKLKELYIKRGI